MHVCEHSPTPQHKSLSTARRGARQHAPSTPAQAAEDAGSRCQRDVVHGSTQPPPVPPPMRNWVPSTRTRACGGGRRGSAAFGETHATTRGGAGAGESHVVMRGDTQRLVAERAEEVTGAGPQPLVHWSPSEQRLSPAGLSLSCAPLRGQHGSRIHAQPEDSAIQSVRERIAAVHSLSAVNTVSEARCRLPEAVSEQHRSSELIRVTLGHFGWCP